MKIHTLLLAILGVGAVLAVLASFHSEEISQTEPNASLPAQPDPPPAPPLETIPSYDCPAQASEPGMPFWDLRSPLGAIEAIVLFEGAPQSERQISLHKLKRDGLTPLANEELLENAQEQPLSLQPCADGFYRICELPAADYSIVLQTKAGPIETRRRLGKTYGVERVIWAGGCGRIWGSIGKLPVETNETSRVLLTLTINPDEKGSNVQTYRRVVKPTDPFEFLELPAGHGTLRLTVLPEGNPVRFVQSSFKIASCEELRIDLARSEGTCELRGKLLSKTGIPIPGASINLARISGGITDARQAQTDDSGAFALRLIPGKYRVVIHKNARELPLVESLGEGNVVTLQTKSVTQDFVIDGATLEVQVIHSGSRGFLCQAVQVRDAQPEEIEDSHGWQQAQANDLGFAQIFGLKPGLWDIQALTASGSKAGIVGEKRIRVEKKSRILTVQIPVQSLLDEDRR